MNVFLQKTNISWDWGFESGVTVELQMKKLMLLQMEFGEKLKIIKNFQNSIQKNGKDFKKRILMQLKKIFLNREILLKNVFLVIQKEIHQHLKMDKYDFL